MWYDATRTSWYQREAGRQAAWVLLLSEVHIDTPTAADKRADLIATTDMLYLANNGASFLKTLCETVGNDENMWRNHPLVIGRDRKG